MGKLSNKLSGKFMQFLACFTILFFLLIPISLAHEDGSTSDLVERGQKLQGKELPGFAAAIFGNEHINVYISSDDGDIEFVSLVTEDKKIKSVEAGQSEDATLNLYISEETIKKIDNSQDVVGAAQKALESKEITYEAIGFFNKIKFGFLSFIFSIFRGSDTPPAETAVINQTIQYVQYSFSFVDPINPTEAELLNIFEGKNCRKASGSYVSNGIFTTTDVGTINAVSNGECVDLYDGRKMLLLWYFPKKDGKEEQSVTLKGIKSYLFNNGKLVDSYSYDKINELERRKYSQFKPLITDKNIINVSTAIEFTIESAKFDKNGKAAIRVKIVPDAIIDYSGKLQTKCKLVLDKSNKKKGVSYFQDLDGKEHVYGECPVSSAIESDPSSFRFKDSKNPSEEELKNILEGKECRRSGSTQVDSESLKIKNGDCVNILADAKLLLLWFFPGENGDDTSLNFVRSFMFKDGKLVEIYDYKKVSDLERRRPDAINSKGDKDRGFSAPRSNVLDFTIDNADFSKDGGILIKVRLRDDSVMDILNPGSPKIFCKIVPDDKDAKKTIAMQFYTDLDGKEHPYFACQGGGWDDNNGVAPPKLVCKEGNVVARLKFYVPSCTQSKVCDSSLFNCEERSVCGTIVDETKTKYSPVVYTCNYGCSDGKCLPADGKTSLSMPQSDSNPGNRYCGGTGNRIVFEKNTNSKVNSGKDVFIKNCGGTYQYASVCGWDTNSKEYGGYDREVTRNSLSSLSDYFSSKQWSKEFCDNCVYSESYFYPGKCVNGACVYEAPLVDRTIVKECSPEKDNFCSRKTLDCANREEAIKKAEDIVPVQTCYFKRRINIFSNAAPNNACNQPTLQSGSKSLVFPEDANNFRMEIGAEGSGCVKVNINGKNILDRDKCSSCKQSKDCANSDLPVCRSDSIASFVGADSNLKAGVNELSASAVGVGSSGSYVNIELRGKYKAKKCHTEQDTNLDQLKILYNGFYSQSSDKVMNAK